MGLSTVDCRRGAMSLCEVYHVSSAVRAVVYEGTLRSIATDRDLHRYKPIGCIRSQSLLCG
jgi:hypothetical protein